MTPGGRREFGEKLLAPRMAGFRTRFERASPGEPRGTRLAGQIVDEVVYPLATASAARASRSNFQNAAGGNHIECR
jgi:hypothetical protein